MPHAAMQAQRDPPPPQPLEPPPPPEPVAAVPDASRRSTPPGATAVASCALAASSDGDEEEDNGAADATTPTSRARSGGPWAKWGNAQPPKRRGALLASCTENKQNATRERPISKSLLDVGRLKTDVS